MLGFIKKNDCAVQAGIDQSNQIESNIKER
jgi:hypothetical protein